MPHEQWWEQVVCAQEPLLMSHSYTLGQVPLAHGAVGEVSLEEQHL